MLVKDLMRVGATSIAPTASVLDAAALMANTQASALPVVDQDGRLLGIVSEADVIKHIATAGQTKDGAGHCISDIMTKDPVTADETGALNEAIDLMIQKHLKVVPVCRHGILTGVLTRAELVRLIASQSAPNSARSSAAEDDALRRSVVAAVKGHHWSLAQRFDAIVKGGTVHLWGIVPNDRVHESYCEAAEQIAGGKAVVSHMHVMPRGMHMTHLG